MQPVRGLPAAGGVKPPLLGGEAGAREGARILLVDPGQLLHDLYQVIYGGLPLHAAAVVNLQGEKRQGRVETAAGAEECMPSKEGSCSVQSELLSRVPSASFVSPSLYHPSHLQVCHHLLHLGPADVQEAFNQVAINEARSWFCLALRVK